MLPVFEYLRNLAAGPGLDPALIGFFMVKIVGVAIPRPEARGVRQTAVYGIYNSRREEGTMRLFCLRRVWWVRQ